MKDLSYNQILHLLYSRSVNIRENLLITLNEDMSLDYPQLIPLMEETLMEYEGWSKEELISKIESFREGISAKYSNFDYRLEWAFMIRNIVLEEIKPMFEFNFRNYVYDFQPGAIFTKLLITEGQSNISIAIVATDEFIKALTSKKIKFIRTNALYQKFNFTDVKCANEDLIIPFVKKLFENGDFKFETRNGLYHPELGRIRCYEDYVTGYICYFRTSKTQGYDMKVTMRDIIHDTIYVVNSGMSLT